MHVFSKIKHFIFICLLGLPFCAKSQLALNLKAHKYDFSPKGYFYQSIIDLRESKYFLGQLQGRNGQKVDLVLNKGTERAFVELLNNNLNIKTEDVALLLEISHLNFKENVRRDGLVEGNVELRLNVSAIFDNDTNLICQPYSTSRYQRSLNSLDADSFETILRELWISCIKFSDDYIRLNNSKMEAFNNGVQIIIEPLETKNKADTVHYMSRLVTWNDFRAEPRNGSKYSAAIFPTIALGTQLTIRDNKLIAVLKPQVCMVPSQSWAKNFARDASGLKHEQIHFDITKVVMDRLLRKLRNIEAKTMDDLSSIIQFEYLEAFKEMNRIQDAYDKETNHNLNSGQQDAWSRKVQAWLLEG
jgi:hypothetical protein